MLMLDAVGALFVGLFLLPVTLGWLGFAALIAFLVLLLMFEGWEAPGSAALFVALCIGALWYLGIVNVPLQAYHHPLEAVLAFVGWFAAGALWAGYKFNLLGYDKAQEYKEAKARYPGNKMETVEDPAGGVDTRGRVKTIEREVTPTIPLVSKEEYIPLALQNKHKLSNWIVLWPLSMAKFCFGELFQRIVNAIITRLGTVYNRLAARHFDGMA